MKKVYIIPLFLIILAIATLFVFWKQPESRDRGVQADYSASQEYWQNFSLIEKMRTQLETGEEVNDTVTKKAVEDLEEHSELYLVSDGDATLFEEYKAKGFSLITKSIQIYSAKTSQYTQFTCLMQREDEYVAIVGNYYQSGKILLVAIREGQ